MSFSDRVTMTAFDGSKKSSWLLADVHGLIYAWFTMWAIGFLLIGLVYDLTGVMLLTPFAHVFELIKERWGSGWAFIAMTLVPSFILAFILVFVLRRNFTVLGPRRQFRYICRWL